MAGLSHEQIHIYRRAALRAARSTIPLSSATQQSDSSNRPAGTITITAGTWLMSKQLNLPFEKRRIQPKSSPKTTVRQDSTILMLAQYAKRSNRGLCKESSGRTDRDRPGGKVYRADDIHSWIELLERRQKVPPSPGSARRQDLPND